MLKKIRDNRGSGFVTGIAFALVVMLIFSCVMIYVENMYTISYVRKEAQETLDRYTTEQGELAMCNIKNGSNYIVTVDETTFYNEIINALGIDNTGTVYENDRVRFKITDTKLQYTADDDLNTTASISMDIPIYLMQSKVSTARGNILVNSKYILKAGE